MGGTDLGKLDLALVGEAMFSKSLVQCSADGLGGIPSLKFGLRPNYGRSNGYNGHPLQMDLGQRVMAPRTAVVSAPDPEAGHCQLTPSPESRTLTGKSAQSLSGSLLLSPGSWGAQAFVVPFKSLFSKSCGSSAIKSHWLSKSNS